MTEHPESDDLFDYCLYCHKRFIAFAYAWWPYCCADCARSAELESTD